jgi:nuclease S1
VSLNLFRLPAGSLIPLHNMKRIFVLLILSIAGHAAFSWGPTGHRVTGWIAEKYLSKKVRNRLEKILGDQSLAMASTWMDEIRSDSTFDFMVDWHWVEIPDGLSYEQTEKNPHGDIIEAVERITGALKTDTLSNEEQKAYTRILIHLVGDVHMPLHVGNGKDHGGNDIKVTWFKRESNLHTVWDRDMIDDTMLSYTELAASLENPTEYEIKAWQKSGIREWARESMALRQRVYDILNNKLGYAYSYKNLHIVRQRLLQAGVRLAGLLNEIFGQGQSK